MKEELISKIIEAEWKMFQYVSNIGGRASCQDNPKTFQIMRTSQARTWTEDLLQSYLEDLKDAEKNDRNLMTEKYARMMESTSPLEYKSIKDQIPALAVENSTLIEKIVNINLEWEDELDEKYPYIRRYGRPIRSKEDRQNAVSLETYLRCELATFSLKTLNQYYDYVLNQKKERINGAELILLDTINQYGFKSLEEANETIMKRLENR